MEKDEDVKTQVRDSSHVPVTLTEPDHKMSLSSKPVLPVHGDDKGALSQGIPCFWYLALVFMVFVYGSYGVLLNLSKVDNRIPFSSSAMNFLIESMKFVVSLSLLSIEKSGDRSSWSWPTFRQALPFAVPAVLYSINNNLSVLMQVHMDPATYHLLGNFKIVTTAVLYRLFLSRPLKIQQWISVGLLTVAGVSDSYGSMVDVGDINLKNQHITPMGLFLITLYCFISASAGVYTEFILKKDLQTSLHIQNMMLYSFSISLNFLGWSLSEAYTADQGSSFSLLKGFSFYTWLIIVTQAFNGLGMSVVFKHGSNLVRLFVISCAMVVSTTLSILVLGVSLNILYFITLLLIVVAIYLYYR